MTKILGVAPVLLVSDVVAAADYYRDKLGFAYERDIIVDERDWLLYRLERPEAV